MRREGRWQASREPGPGALRQDRHGFPPVPFVPNSASARLARGTLAPGTSLPEWCSARREFRREAVANVHYQIIEHDGGWAYKVGDVFSESFPTHDQARDAAERAAAEQKVPGETEPIEYQDRAGAWHEEVAQGDDRPATDVNG
jgi:Uncharacterized protein conserved in bacteria (DUF2188)